MDRLTTDNPANNLETGMNFCFAKDGTATLNYADSAENVNLCNYTAKYCCKNGCEIDAAYVLQEGLTDCYDCQIATMYYLGVQAAETRERLKYYEDLAEQGRLVVLPCSSSGAELYFADINCGEIYKKAYTAEIGLYWTNDSDIGDYIPLSVIGKTVFLTEAEARAALERMEGQK